MRLGYKLTGRLLSISRNGKVFTSGTVYNKRHVDAIKKKLESWASMGWPYVVKDQDND